MISYKLQPARQSKLSTLPVVICYIDYRKIGTHENTDVSVKDDVLNSIKSKGWFGPAITIFKKDRDDYGLVQNQYVDTQYGEFGVADGHHRLESVRYLDSEGLLKDVIIPVQVIPARSNNIRIATLSANELPISIEDVESCFRNRDKIIPVCTSHFETLLKNNSWVRLKEGQPNLIIMKNDLIR